MHRLSSRRRGEARDLLLASTHSYFVYIVANRSHNLYTGLTNNLERGVLEHREGRVPGFTKRYRIYRLVHYEPFGDIRAAIAREKEIKGWGRKKRIALIEAGNPTWGDLAESLFPKLQNQIPRPQKGAS
jgi:putative endonuclease